MRYTVLAMRILASLCLLGVARAAASDACAAEDARHEAARFRLGCDAAAAPDRGDSPPRAGGAAASPLHEERIEVLTTTDGRAVALRCSGDYTACFRFDAETPARNSTARRRGALERRRGSSPRGVTSRVPALR